MKPVPHDHLSSQQQSSSHGRLGHAREARSGAKQPEAFDPARAARLDDPRRFEYLPPAQIAALLDAPKDATVVDFGTGTGTFAIELAGQRPDLTVIALDEQPGMLELLRSKPGAIQLKNLKPVLTDRMAGLESGAERILALNVLHELSDAALRQMIRLLKPEGAILIVDWEAQADRPVGPPKEHTYSAVEAQQRLEAFGLSVEVLKPLRYHFVLRARPAA